jgi:hypothetical protein
VTEYVAVRPTGDDGYETIWTLEEYIGLSWGLYPHTAQLFSRAPSVSPRTSMARVAAGPASPIALGPAAIPLASGSATLFPALAEPGADS